MLPLALAACSQGTYDVDGGDRVTAGSQYVIARGCPTCHQGASAEGVLAGQSTARPESMAIGANLTPDAETGLGNWADIEIVRAMRYGVDNNQLILCPTMPHFDGSDLSQSFMTDVEAYAIVGYLRSLTPVKRPGGRAQSICPPYKEPPGDMAGAAND